MRTRTWVAVLDAERAAATVRAGCRSLATDVLGPADRPLPGDRVALLAARGPRFVADAVFVALAEVRGVDDAGLRLRKIVAAPTGHTVALREVPSLRVAAPWTDARLERLIPALVRCTGRDLERVAAALLTRARAFGPPAARPAHRKPRTPGRRHLLAGRSAARGRP